MGGQYQVLLEDLTSASTAFHTGSADFSQAVPDGLPSSTVDSGDAALDQAVAAALAVIDAFRDRVVTALAETSDQLRVAHDNYARVDGESARELYDDMLELRAIGG